MPTLTEQDIERFWSKVQVGKLDDCWQWQGSVYTSGGYGRFYLNEQHPPITKTACP